MTSACPVVAALSLSLHGGVLSACIGIEPQSEVNAEAPKFSGVKRHSDCQSAVEASLLFPLFGALQPMGVEAGQAVCVSHQGLDLDVLLGRVPALGDELFGVSHGLSLDEVGVDCAPKPKQTEKAGV
jgi:hypothetical protein